MKIEQTLLDRWSRIKRPGDAKHIAATIGVTPNLIYIAFKQGKCSRRVFDAISTYYVEVEKKYADLLERTAHLVTNE